MYYLISKKQYKGDVLFFDCNLEGYKVKPKNKIKGGILVDEMVIIKPDFIKKCKKLNFSFLALELDKC